MRQAVRHAIGNARGDESAIAVTDKDDIAEILVKEHGADVFDVMFQIDLRVRQMPSLTEPRERRREEIMSGCAHQRMHPFPHEACRPCAMRDDECRHFIPPGSTQGARHARNARVG